MRDRGESEAGLAPVIPLFGGAAADVPDTAGPWHASWIEDVADEAPVGPRRLAAEPDREGSADGDAAEKLLTRRLRGKQLSVAEARGVLAEFDLDEGGVERILRTYLRSGFLDDAALAEQLVHVGMERKGQGRNVIARTLSARGIPRDVADEALLALPDDDTDRALEFARTKARSMRSLDHDTAVRRLMGQLARRGYGGSTAMNAAKQALSEEGVGKTGVRFR